MGQGAAGDILHHPVLTAVLSWLVVQADGLRVNELVCQAMRGESDKAPDDDGLTLEWIHGYRCDDCRNNVRYDEAGTVVYHAAAMGVMLTVDEQGGRHRQRFNLVHSDDIISFAMHPNQRVVATGQVGAKPKIQVRRTRPDTTA